MNSINILHMHYSFCTTVKNKWLIECWNVWQFSVNSVSKQKS